QVALRLFEFVARHGIRPAIEAERRVEDNVERLGRALDNTQGLWPAFETILALPHAPLALRALHDTGLLAAIFPELRESECLVIRDFYHRYTVDEHTLV